MYVKLIKYLSPEVEGIEICKEFPDKNSCKVHCAMLNMHNYDTLGLNSKSF